MDVFNKFIRIANIKYYITRGLAVLASCNELKCIKRKVKFA